MPACLGCIVKMASSDSSSDDETRRTQSNATTLASLSTEDALVYLNHKYAERFSTQDALFAEALARPTIPPPIVLDFTGKQTLYGRRSGGYNNNNRRYDNDGGGRRYQDREGGRRFDNDGRRGDYQGGHKRFRN